MLTDGWRYAVYSTPRGALRLLDTHRGRSRSLALPSGCAIVDGQRGYFLASCPDGSGFSVPRVLAARSGHLIAVPGLGRTYFPAGDEFFSIGTRWLRGTSVGQGHPTTEYLNWRSGRVSDFGEESGAATVPRDLDSPGLSRIGPSGLFSVYLRRGPLTVLARLEGHLTPLLLKSASGTTVRLDRCARGCSSASLGARLVTWASGATARAYMPRGHRAFSWHFRRPLSTASSPDLGVQQTAQRLYFNLPSGSSGQAAFRIYTTRAPR